MAKNPVNKIIETDFLKLPKASELYSEFIGQSKIEKLKEEKFVTGELMLGKTQASIVKELSLKHPEENFSKSDIDMFLERNREIVSDLERQKTALARRHLNAKAKLEEELASLAMYTKKLIMEYHDKGDSTATLNAIKILSDLLVRFGKMAGFMDTAPQTNVNITQIMSEKHSEKASRIVEANFKMVDLKKDEEDSNRETQSNQPRDSERLSEGSGEVSDS